MHPALARPISTAQFLSEFRSLWARAGVKGRATVTLSSAMDQVHRANCRRYAEVDVRRRAFHFAPQVLSLPRANRLGLIAHEVGHVLMGPKPHPEWMADAAAFDDLSVSIKYDRRWPGKGLQTGRDYHPRSKR